MGRELDEATTIATREMQRCTIASRIAGSETRNAGVGNDALFSVGEIWPRSDSMFLRVDWSSAWVPSTWARRRSRSASSALQYFERSLLDSESNWAWE